MFSAIIFAMTAGTLLVIPGVSELDDLPAPFVAVKARNEAEVDRIEALAHFAAGRTFQQRGDFDQAVRQYARADRLDPEATTARSNLVAAAVQEKQFPLAVRYALKGVDPQEVGNLYLGRLAIYLTEQGDLAYAIKLYEKALAVSHAKGGSTEATQNAEDTGDIFMRLELGRLFHITSKYAKAVEQFARVEEAIEHPDRFGINEQSKKLLLGKDPGECYELFGETFLLADRLGEAEAAFRKSQSVAPNEILLKFNLARIAARRGQAQEALVGLQSYLDRGSATEGTAPYQLLAEVLKKLGKESELLGRLQKLHVADPSNALLSYFLADQYLKAGRTETAESLYLELSINSPTIFAYRGLAEIYRKARQYDRLLALLGKVMTTTGTLEVLGPEETKPLTSDADLFSKLVEAGRKKAQDSTAKVEYSEFNVLGTLAQEHKQYETANEFFELALKADPTKANEILLTWGIGSLIDDRPVEAAKVFQRGLDMKTTMASDKRGMNIKTAAALGKPGLDKKNIAESNPVFHYYLAGALAACDRLEPALAAARLAVEQKDDSARFASRLPWILFRAKRYDEARQAYEKLFAQFRGEKDSVETLAVLREVRLSMSALSVIQGRLDEAEEWLQQVLDEYPDDIGANNDLGYLWADGNKHLHRALKMILAAVAAEPENRAYRDSLGWVFYRLGRFSEAVEELKKAVDEKQPDGMVLDHLGDAYEKLGRHSQAVAAWQRAKEALEKDKEMEKAGKVNEKIQRTNDETPNVRGVS